MSDPLVAPPENAGDSDAPGEEGLPAGSLLGSGPQNATAPGTDPGEAAPDDDAALAAPAGDPGGSASDLGSSTDAGSLSGSEFGPESSSDPMPDPSDAAPS